MTGVAQRTISATAAKEVLAVMASEGGSPAEIVDARGLALLSDAGEIAGLVDEAFAASPDEAARFCAGEARLLGFFVGVVMRSSGGSVDASAVRAELAKR